MELEPIHESCRSYYGRAHVKLCGSLDGYLLKSYDTVVAYADVDGRLYRMWDDWSRTTARHVAEFARQFATMTPPPNKARWCRMKVVCLRDLDRFDELAARARATLLSLAKLPEEKQANQ